MNSDFQGQLSGINYIFSFKLNFYESVMFFIIVLVNLLIRRDLEFYKYPISSNKNKELDILRNSIIIIFGLCTSKFIS